MQQIVPFVVYAAIAVAAFFVVDGLARVLRVARGIDDDAIDRRLSGEAAHHATPEWVDIVRKRQINQSWARYIPFFPRLSRLLLSSGTGLTVERTLIYMAIISLLVLLPLLVLAPVWLAPISFLIAPLIGVGLVLFYLRRARSKRLAKFEEILPDAIDLIVRSLKIGHPLSGAMAVIARELPAPISTEFGIAFEQTSYGQDIPSALAEMAERIDIPDLRYLVMAVQIQQDSGGNLVESLSKLSGVIRERFRMYRKVKALTAEGRFSALFLSVFPFALIPIVMLIKPDYYTQVMDYQYFPHAVAAAVVLLFVNIVAMRVITALKV